MQIKRVLYILNLLITKNNLKVSISSSKGGVVLIKSEGMLKGIRKGSINSADTSLLMMNQLAKDIKELKIKEMCIYVHGATRWKKLVLRRLLYNLKNYKIIVGFISDITSVPHNGCCTFKKRRKRKRRHLKKKYFIKKNFSRKFASNNIFESKIEKKYRKRLRKGLRFLKYIKKSRIRKSFNDGVRWAKEKSKKLKILKKNGKVSTRNNYKVR